MDTTLPYEEMLRIVRAQQRDPFAVLGCHPIVVDGKKGVAVRAFYPQAKLMYLVEPGKQVRKFPMTKSHQDGFFEIFLPGKKNLRRPYRFEVTDYIGNTSSIYDPYQFLPGLGELDIHLLSEGTHYKAHEKLGCHRKTLNEVEGYLFAVWAPMAKRVSVVGSFNRWDGRRNPMRPRGTSGIWELFVPELPEGTLYKFEICTPHGNLIDKGDPYAFATELRPRTASVTYDFKEFSWKDEGWLERRATENVLEKPISMYEIHLGSWMRNPEEENRQLTYKELAHKLVPYVKDMGYTHIELLPVAEHMFGGSWGYQVTGFFAPTKRFGPPEDFAYFVNHCHEHDIGVILDWVPGHFPKDAHGLANFDGTCCYEHADPRQGEHMDWGTKIFNYGRHEVRNFLISNALFWLENYHIDGIRVDAVASMLYLDYSRKEGEWVPNKFGGKENLDAIDFLRRLNDIIHEYHPGVITIAEESTSFPMVSRPTYLGGLGFDLKWNMGWMHDFLSYMSTDPLFRKWHHGKLTFDLLYAFTENFCLSLSHDEVVHGKASLLGKMPGEMPEKFSNMRLLFAYMYAHPGKKLHFMGGEIGQFREWNYQTSLDWHLLSYDFNAQLQEWVRDLNRLYNETPCLYEVEFEHTGFQWVDFRDSDNSIISFLRIGKDEDDVLLAVLNFTPIHHVDYRVGVPFGGLWREVLNSDAACYGGSNMGNGGGVWAQETSWQEQAASLSLTLPPLSALILMPEKKPKAVVQEEIATDVKAAKKSTQSEPKGKTPSPKKAGKKTD